jgi:hypothetical protein
VSKIIQITIAGTVENRSTQCEAIILALCEDGTLWETTNRERGSKWYQWPTPHETGENI